MKVFLSHATDDKPIAESIAHSIRARGHEVFFDLHDLPAGASYESRIEVAIERCDVFVFLVSPHSVQRGRYTLTEMGLARRKWPTPSGHVLPVMISETAFEAIPSYLRAVTILRPEGNTAAETAAHVDALQPKLSFQRWGRSISTRHWLALALAVAVVTAAAVAVPHLFKPAPEVGRAIVGAGSDIRRIQEALGLPQDGMLGPATTAAISEFQKGANDGKPGIPASLRDLNGPDGPSKMPEMFKSPFERGYLGDPDKHYSVPSPAKVEKAISILDPSANLPAGSSADVAQRLAVMRSAAAKLRGAHGLSGDTLDSSLMEQIRSSQQ